MTVNGYQGAVLSALIMSVVFVSLVFSLAFLIASAQERVIRIAKLQSRTVKYWGGVILLGVGGWTVLLGLFANFFATLFPV